MQYLSSLQFHMAITARLVAVLTTGELSHAYLFTGPSGVGKSALACAFAADILSDGPAEAGNLVTSGTHPDFLLVERQGNFIRIEDIRKAEEWLYRKPYWAHHRVVIIKSAQYLNRESGNALLKTLEEPPDYAVIILVVDSGTRLLPTLVSRCQIISFPPLPTDYVAGQLEDAGVPAVEARLAAVISGGSLKIARMLAEQQVGELLQEGATFLQEAEQGRYQAVILKAEEMEKNNEKRQAFFTVLRFLLHRAALPQMDTGVPLPGVNLPVVTPEAARQLLVKMEEQRGYERVNANPLMMSIDLLWQVFDLVRAG